MDDAERYLDNAAECLRAAQDAPESPAARIRLSMAVSWHSLARLVVDKILGDGEPPAT